MNTPLYTLQPTPVAKLKSAAKYWLLGMAQHDPEYYKVLEVMDFSAAHHNGVRNGGEPEFTHQLSIFHDLRTLHNHLRNPVMVYMLAFLHDTIEDPNQARKKSSDPKVLANAWIDPVIIKDRWGETVMHKTLLMSKEILGQPNPHYNLQAIFEDPDAGIAKLGDRKHNISTMVGVFKRSRLQRYIVETIEEFLPQAHDARLAFPYQEAVYENLKNGILSQLRLIINILQGAIVTEDDPLVIPAVPALAAS